MSHRAIRSAGLPPNIRRAIRDGQAARIVSSPLLGEASSTQAIAMATIDEIAELHSLLAQTESLAHQVNLPLTALLWLPLYKLPGFIIKEENQDGYLTRLMSYLEEQPILFQAILMVGTLSVGTYIYKKIWDRISSFLFSIFPNGVSFSTQKDPAYQLQHTLCSGEEVRQAIARLKELIQQQSLRKKQVHYFTFGSCVLAPLLRNISIELPFYYDGTGMHFGGNFMFKLSGSSTLDFNISEIPYVSIIDPGQSDGLGFLSSVIHSQQGLNLYRFLYDAWVKRTRPSELKKFADRLSILSCISAKWLNKELLEDISSAVFALNNTYHEDESVTFIDQNGKSHSITTQSYLIELHRVLLEEKFPVYAVGNNKFYVAYNPLSEKRSHYIKTRLMERLIHIERQEKNYEQTLQKLNQINHIIAVKKEVWNSYSVYEDGQLKTHFYLKVFQIPPHLQSAYLACLKQIFPLEAVQLRDGIITIKKLPQENIDFEHIQASFIQNLDKIKQNMPINLTYASTVISGTKPKKEVYFAGFEADEKEEEAFVKKAPSYPKKIDFGKGFIFENKFLNELVKPTNYVYPIRVPWLPEGCAYAGLDPDIVDTESLSRERLLQLLENGSVHGTSKSNKTKAGAVGIQNTTEPYTNIHRENVATAAFKLKVGNIRVFGHKFRTINVEGQDRILYMFDGPALGH